MRDRADAAARRRPRRYRLPPAISRGTLRKLAQLDPGGGDHISGLPDDVLGEIIALLPIEDGARTQILSSRWRRLWISAPLDLDCRRIPARRAFHFQIIVPRILNSNLGAVRRFRANTHDDLIGADTLDVWLRSPALDNLKDLHLWYAGCSPLPPPQSVPPPSPSLLRFSPTLRALTLGGCHIAFAAQQAAPLHLPQLKDLALERATVSECSLHGIIAGCPALECLQIHNSIGFRSLRIDSLTLTSIGVSLSYFVWEKDHQLRELVVENAPCLERLLCFDTCSYRLNVSVVSAPRLGTIDRLSERDFGGKMTISEEWRKLLRQNRDSRG